MTRVLILGGTGWLSGRIARRWRDAGAEVTCLARGERPAVEGTVLIRGDRDDVAVYESVSADWDAVIDVSSQAAHVRQAVAALGERTARWTYVSSVSVYADDSIPGADESAQRHPDAVPGEPYDYAAQKSAAETAVASLGDRALRVRPGLIVGAGDPSDRFGYWAAAFDRARDGDVLSPPVADRMTQVIDVEDLAAYICATHATGAVNAVGSAVPLADVLDLFRRAAGDRARPVHGQEQWLLDHGVQHWAGERSLPLWLPADMPGFMTRSNARYLATGGRLRPLPDTVAAVVEDERRRGVGRDRRAGLSRADELALLAQPGV